MAEPITITLPDIYENITEEDINKEKNWTRSRNDNASLLSSLVEALLADAAKRLTQIAYKYNCKPEQFKFAQDKNLREDVAQIMDDLEANIMELVEKYSLNESNNKKRRSKLLPWLMALASKGSKDLNSTLHARLTQFLYDTEAQIAAMLLTGYNQTEAVGRVVSTMHSVYSATEVRRAFKKLSEAKYIKSKGIHEGNKGLSSSGAYNVESFVYQTAVLGWERSHYMDYEEREAEGFYVLRGSNFPCDLCDSKVGFHKLAEKDAMPPFHPHCMCFTVPVFNKK